MAHLTRGAAARVAFVHFAFVPHTICTILIYSKSADTTQPVSRISTAILIYSMSTDKLCILNSEL